MHQQSRIKEKWEKEFYLGYWDYLDLAPTERARSAIIGMFCQHFFPAGKILDVGCGLGTASDFLNSIQKRKYLGLDISEEALKKARKKNVNFQNIDFADFDSKIKFNIIIFNEVLYYMDADDAFKHALNILEEDGKIIVSMFRMKNKMLFQKIWTASRKYFKLVDKIEISGVIKRQPLIWRIEVMRKKFFYEDTT
jgi:2-polyprenyl-6-hydroxyphenyl methylase/3-demethylubiquinone-9 3-methyltransferase